MLVFIRRCQECGHRQRAKRPDSNKPLTDSFRNSKCKKCGSESLDYGSEQELDNDGFIKQEYFEN